MSTLNQGQDVRLIQGGVLVTKAASALPLNTTQNLFSVSGGNVMVNGLVGQVVTALGSTSQTITLGYINTSSPGGTSASCLGTAGTVSSLAATGLIVANPGGAVSAYPATTVGPNTGVGGSTNLKAPYVLGPGTIYNTTNANNATGTVQWYCLYTPLDNGASVSAL